MTQPTHILVADDEEVVVSLVRDCLESDGYEVEVATSGAEAEEFLRNQRFDLLITDIRMPDFDGIELLRRAKTHQESIGAIFMTGYANMQSAKDAIKEGALDYLMKPFEIEEIRASVRNAIEKLAARNENRAEVELDRMTRVTRLMHAVDDLPSLMRTALSAALLQCDLTRGGAIYFSPENSELIRIFSEESDDGVDVASIPLASNPFENIQANCPELQSEFILCQSIDKHPLVNERPDDKIAKLIKEKFDGTDEPFVSFVIGRNNKIFGLLLISLTSESLAELADEFKFVSLTAQQTALSIENLLLLKETQDAYLQLQGLQQRAISLETMAARGEFAAEIGHELKNFLGVVYGNFSLLERHLESLPGARDSSFGKYFEAITSNLEKMKRFSSDLMRETRLAGKKELITINSQLHELARFMRPQTRFNGVALVINVPSELALMEIDPVLFQQLIYNLANNAADACRDGDKPRVEISLEHVEEDKDSFTIAVRDNGSGIEPEMLKKAFESRFTTKSDGNGFGLMVCRKIIDAHQGALQIFTDEGSGTTISITFPRATANGQSAHSDTARIDISAIESK